MSVDWEQVRKEIESLAPWDWQCVVSPDADEHGLYTEREDGKWIMILRSSDGRWEARVWDIEADIDTLPEVQVWGLTIPALVERITEWCPLEGA